MPFDPKTVQPDAPAATPATGFDPKTVQSREQQQIAKAAAALPDMGAGDIYKDRFTLGLQGPVSGLSNALAGGVASLLGKGDDSTFGERYTAGESAYDQKLKEAQAKSGALGTVASVAGMLTPGGAGERTIIAAPNMFRTAGQAATLGGIQAGANARGDLADRMTQAGEGAVVGGLTGALTDRLLGLLPGSARGVAREADRAATRGPPAEETRQLGRDLFQQLDQSGTAYSAPQANQLATDAATNLRQAGYDRAINARANAIVDDLTGHQGPMTLDQLQNLRSRTAELARGNDANDRRIAGVILNSIDNHVGNVDPALSQLPPGQVGPMWQQARQYWRTAALTDDLGWMVDKATRRAASTNSGQNVENAIRQNIRQVQDRVTRPGAYNPYTDEQMGLINQVVQGTPTQNTLRTAGNWLRSIPGASATGGVTTAGLMHGLSTGDPMTAIASAALPLASYGASRAISSASRNMAENAVDQLIGNVARGGAPALTAAQRALLQGPPTREALALMRSLGLTERLATNVGGAVGGQM